MLASRHASKPGSASTADIVEARRLRHPHAGTNVRMWEGAALPGLTKGQIRRRGPSSYVIFPSPLPFLYQAKLWQHIGCTLDFGVHLVFCHTFCVGCYTSATPASMHFVFRLKTMGVHHRSCGRANGFAPNLSVHFVLGWEEFKD